MHQTPTQQVAHALAHCAPGAMPELPPFLVVDLAEQERRDAWRAAHPIEPTKFMRSEPTTTSAADEVYRQRVAAERATASAAKREKFTAFRQSRSQAWVMSLPEADRRWSTRLGRFIPECIPGLERMRLVDALKAIELLAERELKKAPEKVAQRRIKARCVQATTTRHAKPVVAPAAAPRPKAEGSTRCAVPGGEADTITKDMLHRPEGVTQDELAARLSCTGDAARGRISKVVRGLSLNVHRTKEARGRVYRC